MPAPPGTIIETFDSGRAMSGDTETNELRYIVTDVAAESDVIALVAYTAPTSIGPMERKAIDVQPLGNEVWDCTVAYEGKPDESQYTFETGGATTHITQSLSTIGRYPVGDPFATPPVLDPPDFKGAIGVNGDNIEGTDITVPQFNFTETRKVASSAVDGAYKLALFHCTGKVNNATFKGFAAGEVLFLGASGSKRGYEHWEITFKFAASPNAADLPVGDFTVDDKKGWEYLWVRFQDAEDDDAKALVKRPIAAYVEQVYESADFSTLGIGT